VLGGVRHWCGELVWLKAAGGHFQQSVRVGAEERRRQHDWEMWKGGSCGGWDLDWWQKLMWN